MSKRPSFFKTLLKSATLLPVIFSLLGNIISLVGHEARVAGKNIILLVIFAVVIASMLTATWFGILAFIFVYLNFSLHWTMASALLSVILLNLLVLIIIGVWIGRIRKKIFFPMTRKQIRYLARTEDW